MNKSYEELIKWLRCKTGEIKELVHFHKKWNICEQEIISRKQEAKKK